MKEGRKMVRLCREKVTLKKGQTVTIATVNPIRKIREVFRGEIKDLTAESVVITPTYPCKKREIEIPINTMLSVMV